MKPRRPDYGREWHERRQAQAVKLRTIRRALEMQRQRRRPEPKPTAAPSPPTPRTDTDDAQQFMLF